VRRRRSRLELLRAGRRGRAVVVAPGGTLGANGRAVDGFRLPNDPSLSGQFLHLQALVGPIPRHALTERVVVGIN